MKVNVKLLKPVICKEESAYALVTIKPAPVSIKNKAKVAPKNISVALDVSSSMNESIKRGIYPNRNRVFFGQNTPFNPNPLPIPQSPVVPLEQLQPLAPPVQPFRWPSDRWPGDQQKHWLQDGLLQKGMNMFVAPEVSIKIDLAKKAIITLIDEMEQGDTFSLVCFNNTTSISCPPTTITPQSKEKLKLQVLSIGAYGNTDLHNGWLQAQGQCAQSYDSKKINRVIVISDGQTNSGIMNKDTICQRVQEFFNSGISTSTIGVGEDFNETLLSAMSEAGGGDFHYVENGTDFASLMRQELENITQTQASLMTLDIKSHTGIQEAIVLNGFTKTATGYQLPNLTSYKDVEFLVQLKPQDTAPTSSMSLELNYTNSQGERCVHPLEIAVAVVSKEQSVNMPEDNDVKAYKLKLMASQQLQQAADMAKQGNIQGAKSLLGQTRGALANFDPVLMNAYIAKLDASEQKLSTESLATSTKFMASASYDSRRGKF